LQLARCEGTHLELKDRCLVEWTNFGVTYVNFVMWFWLQCPCCFTNIEIYVKGLGLMILTWIFAWCTKSFCKNLKIIRTMGFSSHNHELWVWLSFFIWTLKRSIDSWCACVKDLELIRYHIKEVKGGKKFMITIVWLYKWTFEEVEKRFLSKVHIILEEEVYLSWICANMHTIVIYSQD
jgi:hypothetical protein